MLTMVIDCFRDFSVDIFPNDITSGKLYSASLPLRLISKIDNDVFYLVFPSGFEKELWVYYNYIHLSLIVYFFDKIH